mgnify:CR=1 FL=1|tara:strand:- start:1567 stop:2094 length:528 start_codon:yes stop_codon:yes gene_type:complete
MNWFLDGLAFFYIIVIGTIGFKRGFLEELGRLLGIVASVMIGMDQYVIISDRIVRIFNIDILIASSIGFISLFLFLIICSRLLTRFFQIAFLSKENKWVNNLLGFVFGSIKGYVIIILFIWIINLFPLNKWSKIIISNSKIASRGTLFQKKAVDFFGWESPINKGESFLKDLIYQ